jgi:hypothetical protein
MVFTILCLVAVIALVAFLVIGVQKAKAKKANADKCPYHGEEVGYETSAPAPVKETPVATKKKPATKKPAPKVAVKKTKSSTK